MAPGRGYASAVVKIVIIALLLIFGALMLLMFIRGRLNRR
jgi:hypothetical protein